MKVNADRKSNTVHEFQRDGETLYCIQNDKTGFYFVWAYTNKSLADVIANRVYPESAADIANNWRTQRSSLIKSERDSI